MWFARAASRPAVAPPSARHVLLFVPLLLFAQTGGSIPTPFLIILVFWLSAIFVSFTLFAQTNLVVMASLLACALSFAGAIFLVLELDNPFT